MSRRPSVDPDRDVSSNLRLEGIRRMFIEKAGSKGVAVMHELRLTTNWSIVFELKQHKDEDTLEMYLVNAQGPTTISYKIILTYLSGKCFFSFKTPSSGVVLDGRAKRTGRTKLLTRNEWEADSILQQDDALLVSVQVCTPPGQFIVSDATAAIPPKLLTSVEPKEISFIAFTKRNHNGILTGARDYSASSATLGASSTFLKHWLKDKRSTRFWSMVQSRRDQRNSRTTYMDPDSDFEDEDEDITEEGPYDDTHVQPIKGPANRRNNTHDTAVPRRSEGQDRVLSDINGTASPLTSIDAVPFVRGASDAEVSPHTSENTAAISTSNGVPVAPKKSILEDHTYERGFKSHGGTVFIVTGISAKTWGAILYYMCTSNIGFTPLKSEGERVYNAFMHDYSQENPDRPPPCSCKSVYRVAKAMRMVPLQNLALAHLKSRLSTKNIISEYFSKFTSQHEEVKKLQFTIFAEHWDIIRSTTAFHNFLEDVVNGKHPHVGPTMAAIFANIPRIETTIRTEVAEKPAPIVKAARWPWLILLVLIVYVFLYVRDLLPYESYRSVRDGLCDRTVHLVVFMTSLKTPLLA